MTSSGLILQFTLFITLAILKYCGFSLRTLNRRGPEFSWYLLTSLKLLMSKLGQIPWFSLKVKPDPNWMRDEKSKMSFLGHPSQSIHVPVEGSSSSKWWIYILKNQGICDKNSSNVFGIQATVPVTHEYWFQPELKLLQKQQQQLFAVLWAKRAAKIRRCVCKIVKERIQDIR